VESRRSAAGVPDIIILTIQTLSSPTQQQTFIIKAENVHRFSDNTISLTTERIQGRTAIQMKKPYPHCFCRYVLKRNQSPHSIQESLHFTILTRGKKSPELYRVPIEYGCNVEIEDSLIEESDSRGSVPDAMSEEDTSSDLQLAYIQNRGDASDIDYNKMIIHRDKEKAGGWSAFCEVDAVRYETYSANEEYIAKQHANWLHENFCAHNENLPNPAAPLLQPKRVTWMCFFREGDKSLGASFCGGPIFRVRETYPKLIDHLKRNDLNNSVIASPARPFSDPDERDTVVTLSSKLSTKERTDVMTILLQTFQRDFTSCTNSIDLLIPIPVQIPLSVQNELFSLPCSIYEINNSTETLIQYKQKRLISNKLNQAVCIFLNHVYSGSVDLV